MNNRSKRRYEIACIFFCEFHDKIGYKIVHQCPPDFIKKEQFRKISPFILPNQKECYTLSALKLGELCLVGCPIFLENTLYDRNSYLFNLGILLSRKAYIENYRFYDLLVEKFIIDLKKKYYSNFLWFAYELLKNMEDIKNEYIDEENESQFTFSLLLISESEETNPDLSFFSKQANLILSMINKDEKEESKTNH